MPTISLPCDARRRLGETTVIEDTIASLDRVPLVERFPLAPLVRLTELHAGRELPVTELVARFGLGAGNRASIYRARAHGLPAVLADRWSIAAGFHPALVWGIEWFDGGEAA